MTPAAVIPIFWTERSRDKPFWLQEMCWRGTKGGEESRWEGVPLSRWELMA